MNMTIIRRIHGRHTPSFIGIDFEYVSIDEYIHTVSCLGSRMLTRLVRLEMHVIWLFGIVLFHDAVHGSSMKYVGFERNVKYCIQHVRRTRCSFLDSVNSPPLDTWHIIPQHGIVPHRHDTVK